jgi:transposase InsO family protein
MPIIQELDLLLSRIWEEEQPMADDNDRSSPRRWAELRFSVIGPLLTRPPGPGELGAAVEELSRQRWLHPGTGDLVNFGASTIERWYYQARAADDPLAVLTAKVRKDRGTSRAVNDLLLAELRKQYKLHSSWSYQLHRDNLAVLCEANPEDLGSSPSTSTVRRRMVDRGWRKRKKRRNPTPGQKKAEERLEKREVRSFEVSHVHLLWHFDFHVGHRRVVLPDASYHTPVLLAILDDRSRLCCHIQWYLAENSENLFHGLCQAYLKRGLPRSQMHDNGSAMKAAEIERGAQRSGIKPEPTLAFSPYQNGKQETFWETVEGRLMAMLERVEPLELSFLNRATLAWAEYDYNRAIHSELGTTPLERMLEGPDVSRRCPDLEVLRQRFVRVGRRTQRRGDGTISVEGVRFELPNRFRSFDRVRVGYRKWDLSMAYLIDERTDEAIARIYPVDKERNANCRRRSLEPLDEPVKPLGDESIDPVPPLMRKILADYAATGLPPAYLPKDELVAAGDDEEKGEQR